MKHSVRTAAYLLPLASGVLSACRTQPEMMRCVDHENHVVSNYLCELPPQLVRVPFVLYPVPLYRFYYGGLGTSEIGSDAWEGSDRPVSGHIYQTVAQTASASVAGQVPK